MVGALAAALIVRMLPKTARAGTTAVRASDSRILAEHVVDMVSTHERDGTFRYVSSVFAGMIGEYPGSLIGKNPRDYAHPEDRETLAALWPRATGWTETAATITWRCRQHNGQYAWIESTARSSIGEAAKMG